MTCLEHFYLVLFSSASGSLSGGLFISTRHLCPHAKLHQTLCLLAEVVLRKALCGAEMKERSMWNQTRDSLAFFGISLMAEGQTSI